MTRPGRQIALSVAVGAAAFVLVLVALLVLVGYET